MNLVRRLILITLVMAALAAGYLFLYPSPIDPAAWTPPPAPGLTGVFAPNERLRAARRLAEGAVHGPEDVAIGADGALFAGTADGAIVRVDAAGGVTTFARTGGRPLGLAFDAESRLVVADAHRGLLRVDSKGAITTLATEANGVPFRFTNDVDIARDGTIYFSDASDRFSQPEYKFDLLEARPHGRLLAYDPQAKRVTVLLRGLYFANGVALSRNEDFVLVNETYRYRIRRFWLKGEKRGSSDMFAENLPGFPDGLSSDRRGSFWLALFTRRNDRVDQLHPSAFKKRIVAKLPQRLWPKAAPYGLIARFDESGRAVESLHDTKGEVIRFVTSVEATADHLYLGTLDDRWIGALPRTAP